LTTKKKLLSTVLYFENLFRVDWDSIDIFHNEMEMVPEEEHFDFEDDL
jgi:hypothetical protein